MFEQLLARDSVQLCSSRADDLFVEDILVKRVGEGGSAKRASRERHPATLWTCPHF